MRRRNFISLVAGAAVFPMPAWGQRRPQQIGWLGFGRDANNQIEQTLQEALAQNGLVDGRNINIARRFAKGNSAQLAPLAEELSALKPDVLLGVGGDVIKALFVASKGGIPVVGGVSDDPVRAGLAVSLARPGKNFTGVTFLTDEMAAKRMELLKEAVPGAKRVAVIYNPQHLDNELTFARRGAELLGIDLSAHPISRVADLDKALQAAVASRADCLFAIASRLTNLHSVKIVQFGLKAKIPVVAAWREFVANGALLSYGPDRILQAKRIADYVKKILNGAKPGDLPIERPAKFELVFNLKTARALGLTIGREFLLRADHLIE
jgi:putative ABC transport system substrate-binding protein